MGDICEWSSIISTILNKGHHIPEIKDIYIPEEFIDFYEKISGKKIIVINENEEDVTDLFMKEGEIVKSYLIKSKIYKYKYVNPDYEKKIERNDVYIYKTIFLPQYSHFTIFPSFSSINKTNNCLLNSP